MASNDGEDNNILDDSLREASEVEQRETSADKDDADGNAHDEATLRLNPEALRGITPLPGLDDVEVILIQPAPVWARWTEGLVIHVVGSGVVAVLAFIAGVTFAGSTNKAEGAVKQPASCITTPVSAPKDNAE